jgi:tRNA nucleotidyltransferase (CCA-adding enzyme)
VIQASTLVKDLQRRDFTVNAIAAALSEDRFGEVLDPHGGRADLEAGRLRILHPRSFLDDPTRLFRAARYAVRLGLEPDNATEAAAVEAVRRGALRTISGDRRRNEATLLCGERLWAEAIAWLNRWEVWEHLAEGFTPRAAALKRVDTARNWMTRNSPEPLAGERDARWLAFLLAAPPAARHALRARASEMSILHKAETIVERVREPADGLWYREMDAMPANALMLALTRVPSDSDKARLTHYITAVRPVRLDISGHDLRRAGIDGGPAIRRALERTLDARRAGALATRDEQLAYAVAEAREEGRL